MHISDLRYLYQVVHEDMDIMPAEVPRNAATLLIYAYIFNIFMEALLLRESPRFICKQNYFFAYAGMGEKPGTELPLNHVSSAVVFKKILDTDPCLAKILPVFTSGSDDFALAMPAHLPTISDEQMLKVREMLAARNLPKKAREMKTHDELASLQDEILTVLEQHTDLLSRPTG
ncbi:hypothetical protein KKG46_04495 [Patescibacteria group bacterium]|nr:hypothetical protein [Patescibacteria group bacterium]